MVNILKRLFCQHPSLRDRYITARSDDRWNLVQYRCTDCNALLWKREPKR